MSPIVVETIDTEEEKGQPLWEVGFLPEEIAWLRRSGVIIEHWIESALNDRFALHGVTFSDKAGDTDDGS